MLTVEQIKTDLSIAPKSASILTIAKALHRTHKNKKLIIEPGTILESIYKDMSALIAVKKAVQLGVSEYLIVLAITTATKGYNVLYVFPTFGLKNQFVQDRVNKTILFTKYYNSLTKGQDRKLAESVSLKQFMEGTVLFVGSGTPVSFISYPADLLIVDEKDQCDLTNLLMADERLANSIYKHKVTVSNPTYLGIGIDKDYNESDKKTWIIKHSCGNYIHIDFFKHIVKEIEVPGKGKQFLILDKEFTEDINRDVYPICEHCNKPINRFSTGEAVPEFFGKEISGHHMSSIFSKNISIRKLLSVFKEGLANDTQMQRFYNAYLGLAYTPSGSKLTSYLLDKCKEPGYTMPSHSHKPTIAGVDVGKVFNILIGDYTGNKIRILNISELNVETIQEVIDLFIRYNVKMFVIDARPETRIAVMLIAICANIGKYGWLSQFTQSKLDMTWNPKNNIISSGRTYTLDLVKESVMLENLILPDNAHSVKNFYPQMTSSTRVFNEQRQDYEWVESSPDHFFLAMAYLHLAKLTLVQAR